MIFTKPWMLRTFQYVAWRIKMPRPERFSRRHFLKKSAALAVGGIAAPYVIPSGVLAGPDGPGANDRIGIGWIGTGRRSHQMIGDLKGTRSLPAECRPVRSHDPGIDDVGVDPMLAQQRRTQVRLRTVIGNGHRHESRLALFNPGLQLERFVGIVRLGDGIFVALTELDDGVDHSTQRNKNHHCGETVSLGWDPRNQDGDSRIRGLLVRRHSGAILHKSQ